jgi:uncharacterized membrane protein (UPF0136 family)
MPKLNSTQFAMSIVPFGIIVAAGGAMGYIKKGSIMSLFSGIVVCGTFSRI